MTQSDNKKIFYGALSGASLSAVSIIVTFIQLRLILEFLPNNIAGVWLLFLSLGTYIAFFDMGISPTLSREIAFALGNTNLDEQIRKQKIADLLSTCLRIFIVLAIAVFSIGLIGGSVFLQSNSPSESQKEIEISWLIFLMGSSINIIGGAIFASLYGLGDVATERVIRSLSQMLGLGLSFLSLYFGFGITGLATAWVFQNIIARGVAAVVLYRRHHWLKSIRGRVRKELYTKIIYPSLKWSAQGFGAILILQTDNVIIAMTLGPAAIPQYDAVAKIAMTLMIFSLLIVNSTTPFLSKAYAAGNVEVLNEMVLRNVRFGMSVIVFLVSFMAIFGDRIIHLWLGPDNFVGFPVLWTLLLMVLLETHHSSLAVATMSTGRIVFVWVAIVAGVLNILISLTLIRYLGLLGVALGTMIAQMLTNNWYVPIMTLRYLKISKKTYFNNTLLPIGSLLLSCLTFNFLLSEILQWKEIFSTLFFAMFMSSALAGLIFYYVILNREERAVVAARIRC